MAELLTAVDLPKGGWVGTTRKPIHTFLLTRPVCRKPWWVAPRRKNCVFSIQPFLRGPTGPAKGHHWENRFCFFFFLGIKSTKSRRKIPFRAESEPIRLECLCPPGPLRRTGRWPNNLAKKKKSVWGSRSPPVFFVISPLWRPLLGCAASPAPEHVVLKNGKSKATFFKIPHHQKPTSATPAPKTPPVGKRPGLLQRRKIGPRGKLARGYYEENRAFLLNSPKRVVLRIAFFPYTQKAPSFH